MAGKRLKLTEEGKTDERYFRSREHTGQEELNDRMKLEMKGFIVDYYDLGGGSDDKDSLFQHHRRGESVKQEETGPGNK